MIDVTLTKESVNNRTVYELYVKGHAVTEDGTRGSEGVCGAVSCLVTTLESYIDNRSLGGSYTGEDGYAHLTFVMDAPDTAEDVMTFVEIGLRQIERSYPEYIRVEICTDGVADKEKRML